MSGTDTSSLAAGKPDQAGFLRAWTVTLTLLGLIFVGLRLWVRIFRKKALGWDDYWIIAAAASSIVSLSLSMAMTSHGYGNSFYTLSAYDRVEALKFSNFSILVNGFNMAFLKISIGAALLRLGLGKEMTIIIWIFIVISVLCNAMVIPGSLLLCKPMDAIWNKSLPSYSCWPKEASVGFSYTQTVGNIVTDLFYSIGPLIYLARVLVSKYNKWALRGVFLIGLSATACAIAKCWELPKLATTKDPTWDGMRLTIWVRAEFNVGLIGACVPSLKSLFEQSLKRVFGLGSLKTSTPSGTPGYGRHSTNGYNMSRLSKRYVRSQAQKLPDNDLPLDNAHRHYASATANQTITDSDSTEEEDQKHILRSHVQVSDEGMDGSDVDVNEHSVQRSRPGPGITKTVEFQVRREV